jgi:hypothetical protein
LVIANRKLKGWGWKINVFRNDCIGYNVVGDCCIYGNI